MIFHENRLLADDSYEVSFLIFSKIRKDVAKFVVCCSSDWRFKSGWRGVPDCVLANSDKAYEILRSVAIQLGLHCLQKIQLRGFQFTKG